jgi:hypothetical protein
MSDDQLLNAFRATHMFLAAAVDDLHEAEGMADRGDLDTALTQISMGVNSRLSHAAVELKGVVERLQELGGKYLPPSGS